MRNNKHESVKTALLNVPFGIMLVFSVVHLSVYIQISIGAARVSFSSVNQICSMLYVCVMYLWALLVNPKRHIKVTALFMGILSVCGFLISWKNMGDSLNDLLFTGTAILTVFYIFENAEYLLGLTKRADRYLTVAIWGFVVFSVVLFVFFPNKQHQWGEGTFFYGHRYASVCSLMIMLTGLKLTNRPRCPALYWILMLGFFYICFWTGARVYMLSNLGQIYAMLFVFRRNNKDFILKCIAVTLAVVVVFFSSSSVSKVNNIVEDIKHNLEQNTAVDAMADSKVDPKIYEWVEGLSNGRWSIWDNCIRSYAKLPVFNKLFGSGNKYIYDHNVLPSGETVYAHTDFINILHFNGLLGLSVYLLVFIGYVARYWRKNHLHVILLIGFWGVWFVLALLNGYGNYTADMMSLPYLGVLAYWEKQK